MFIRSAGSVACARRCKIFQNCESPNPKNGSAFPKAGNNSEKFLGPVCKSCRAVFSIIPRPFCVEGNCAKALCKAACRNGKAEVSCCNKDARATGVAEQ